MSDIEIEAAAEGPTAVAELSAFDEQFHLAAQFLQTKPKAVTHAE